MLSKSKINSFYFANMAIKNNNKSSLNKNTNLNNFKTYDHLHSNKINLSNLSHNITNNAAQSYNFNGFYKPSEIYTLYNIPSSMQAAPSGVGVKRQIIAIVDAYGYSTAYNDLLNFCNTYTSSSKPTLISATNVTQSILQTNNNPLTFNFCIYKMSNSLSANTGWAEEQALDCQWAHAIAPAATILLVQAVSSSTTNLNSAIAKAISLGASVISMSWGGGETSSINTDTTFTNKNVVFVASSGDGAYYSPTFPIQYPASSANVLAVGGTTISPLSISNSSIPRNEYVWNSEGFGISNYVAQPTWQTPVVPTQTTTQKYRAVPDVVFVADPYTGVVINYAGSWYSIGGTSVSAPCWAGIIALANQQRVSASPSKPLLTNATLLPALYNSTSSALFNNLSNFFISNSSLPAYQQVYNYTTPNDKYNLPSGLGSPNVANMINYLASI